MKKLPKAKKKVKKLGQKVDLVAKNLPWINLVLTGSALSFLLFFASFSSFLGIFKTPAQYPAEPIQGISSGKPLGVFIGNVTGEQITVAVITEIAGHASLYLKEGETFRRFGDDRGEMTTDKIHLITLRNLSPETDYKAMICGNLDCEPKEDGSREDWYGMDIAGVDFPDPVNPQRVGEEYLVSDGPPLQLKTGASLEIAPQKMALVFGTVKDESNHLLGKTALLRITLRNEGGFLRKTDLSSPLLTLFEANQGWSIDLANARGQDNQSFFQLRDETKLQIYVTLGNTEETFHEDKYNNVQDQPMEIKIEPAPVVPSLQPTPTLELAPSPTPTKIIKPIITGRPIRPTPTGGSWPTGIIINPRE